jgi:hypothetical protein
MVRSTWPFSNSPNLGVITLEQVIQKSAPVLHVRHDADDGGWQFIGLDHPRMGDTMVVSLQKVVTIDPTLTELADLPLGWHAWRRGPTEPWVKEPIAS